MEEILRRKLILCTLFVLIKVTVICARECDSNATSFEEVDAKMLLRLGKQFNKPVLTLIGMAITNLHACSQWSTWSPCSAMHVGYFGIMKRTRKCGINSQQLLEGKTETDFSICKGLCPEDYTITANGFCMKLYTVKRNHEDAEKQCNNDGGHLVHIDSEQKYTDVGNFYKVYSSSIHIDGRRKDVNSPWTRSDGSPVEFFKWGGNDPDNGSDDLCLHLSTDKHWYDSLCTTSRAFICEI